MRVYKYHDSSGVHMVTDEEIMKHYFPVFKERVERLGLAEMATPENCIENFLLQYFAEEVKQNVG